MLLGELLNKFPLPLPPQMQAQHLQHQQQQQQQQPQAAQNQQNGVPPTTSAASTNNASGTTNVASKMILKTEPIETADERSPLVDIKQEIDLSPGGNGNVADNGMDVNIKLEPNEMKPPPEKKMKM